MTLYKQILSIYRGPVQTYICVKYERLLKMMPNNNLFQKNTTMKFTSQFQKMLHVSPCLHSPTWYTFYKIKYNCSFHGAQNWKKKKQNKPLYGHFDF